MDRTLIALALGSALGSVLAPALAWAQPSPNACLAVDNARSNNQPITVEIDGYGGYWVIPPNQTYTISAAHNGASDAESRGAALHGSTFNLRVYDGDESRGSKGALYDVIHAAQTPGSYGSASHTLLTPVSPSTTPDPRFPPECVQSGFWLALVHD